MKNRSSKLGTLERRLMILCLILIMGGAALVIRMPQRLAAMEQQRKYDSEFYEFADLFSEIYSTIRERYVDEVASKQLFEGAINGMFATLDPHSAWEPPDAQEMLTRDTEGEYSGVGLHITLDKSDILTVITPIAGSPAAVAGVQPWDRIIEIDGKSTKGISTIDAVKQLTGPTGSSVRIKVWREGKTYDFTVKRETIKVNSVFSKIMDGNIGYLRITKFQEDTADALARELKTFNEKKIHGVVVDLRFNPGGLLDRAVECCDYFLPKGQIIVSIKGRNKANNREYYSTKDPICTVPLVVLVNYGSASGAEIFAGAMKDTKRGVIIGPESSTTYGKGSVQTISTINKSLERDKNGDYRPSGIRLTTARYYTPSGVSIHEKGIKPDIGVKLPEGHEIALLKHGLLGDPSLDGFTGDEESLKPDEGQEEEKPLQGAPESILNKARQKERNMRRMETPAPKSKDANSSLTLEQILNSQMQKSKPAAAANGNGKTPAAPKGEIRDILLDESIKYLKAGMLFEARKAA